MNLFSVSPQNVVQSHLVSIQPEFKTNLMESVQTYKQTLVSFLESYGSVGYSCTYCRTALLHSTLYCICCLQSGPMVPGLHPREASERLTTFQAQFDELWRKYQTYSGGEKLFGMTVTDYPALQNARKELGLLQKLYGLYNMVIDTIDSYYDILWTEVS